MDRLYYLICSFFLAGILGLSACQSQSSTSTSSKSETLSRFESAAEKPKNAGTSAASAAARNFCDSMLPAAGEGSRRWQVPPERPLPPGTVSPSVRAGVASWRWVNLWASWCGPCTHEMPLLGTWQKSLEESGIRIDFELWSLDDDGAELAGASKQLKLPGPVHWLRSAEDINAVLDNLGVDKNSAIPIHALVDQSGMLRCVRVGSVGEQNFAAVKAMLSGRM